MKDFFRKLEEVSRSAGGASITRVHVTLGALSHFDEAHFREHFREDGVGSPARNAELVITLSTDIHSPHAQGLLLEKVEVDEN